MRKETGEPGIIDHIFIFATEYCRAPGDKYAGYSGGISEAFTTQDHSIRDPSIHMHYVLSTTNNPQSTSTTQIIGHSKSVESRVRWLGTHLGMHELLHNMDLNDLYSAGNPANQHAGVQQGI